MWAYLSVTKTGFHASMSLACCGHTQEFIGQRSVPKYGYHPLARCKVDTDRCATPYTMDPDQWRHSPREEQPMGRDNPFQSRGVCTTCQRRSAYLNADSL